VDRVVLGTLSGGPAGFRALARAVDGISNSMLSERLGRALRVGIEARLNAATPLGRGTRAVEIASAVSWLLSDGASYVNRAVLVSMAGWQRSEPDRRAYMQEGGMAIKSRMSITNFSWPAPPEEVGSTVTNRPLRTDRLEVANRSD
jgi:hypothetical protein